MIKTGELPLCGNTLRLLLCISKVTRKIHDICKYGYRYMLILHK